MRSWVYGSRVVVLAAMLAAGFAAEAIAQTETKLSDGCTLNRDVYTCNKDKFVAVLANAKTAKIEVGPTDKMGEASLTKLIGQLGKTVVPRDQHADITFLMIPIDPSGVAYNTGDTQIATLRVFAAGPDEPGRGALVWAENFTGPEDLQWFTVVNRLILQFKDRFHIK